MNDHDSALPWNVFADLVRQEHFQVAGSQV